MIGIALVPRAENVRIRFQRDRVITAAGQNPTHVEFGEARNPKLAVLLVQSEVLSLKRSSRAAQGQKRRMAGNQRASPALARRGTGD